MSNKQSLSSFNFGSKIAGEISILDKNLNRKLHEQFLCRPNHFINLQQIFSQYQYQTD